MKKSIEIKSLLRKSKNELFIALADGFERTREICCSNKKVKLPVFKCCSALDKAFKNDMISFVAHNSNGIYQFIKWLDIYGLAYIESTHCPFCGKKIKNKNIKDWDVGSN